MDLEQLQHRPWSLKANECKNHQWLKKFQSRMDLFIDRKAREIIRLVEPLHAGYTKSHI